MLDAAMRLILFCLCLAVLMGFSPNVPADDNFDVTLVGQDAALCAGQCVDFEIQINGGTAPFRLVFMVQGTFSFDLTNYDDALENTLRICHDPTVPGAFLDGGQIPRVLRIPTTSLDMPYSVEIVQVTSDGPPMCNGTVLAGGPFLITDGQTNSAFTADIPRNVCDSLILPEISPALPGVQYYSEPAGGGIPFNPGDILDSDNIQLANGDLLDTLYIFDPSGNCGEAELPFSLIRTPMHNVPPDLTICEEYVLEPFSGSFITPLAQYATTRDFEIGSTLSVGDVISSSTQIYIRDTNLDLNTLGTCTFLDSFFVEISPVPFTGIDTTIFVCSGEPTIIADPIALIGNPDPGGLWSGPNLPGLDFNNFMNIDVTDLAPGTNFTFTYGFDVPGCGVFSTDLIIEAVALPDAGTSTTVSLCSAVDIDFTALIDNPEPGGFWNQLMGEPVNVGDGSSVDMTGVSPGTYQFLYSIISPDCPQQDALLEIELATGINAGRDTSTMVCWMETVDLNTFLSDDAEPGGIFVSVFPIPGGIWNTSTLLIDPTQSNSVQEVLYILDGVSTNCPSDTAIIEVNLLVGDRFAGIPMSNSIQVCQDELINLNELLTGEDGFGNYFLTTDLSTPIDSLWEATTSSSIIYIVPGAGACNADSSTLNLNTVPPASIDLSISSTSICDNECTMAQVTRSRPMQVELRLEDNNSNQFDFVLNPFDLDFVRFCPGQTLGAASNDTIFIGTANSFDLGILNIEDTQFDCNNSVLLNTRVTFAVDNSFEETFTGTVCEGGSTMINGVSYDASIDLNLQTSAGCDSIIHIVIDTIALDTGMIMRNFCTDAGPQVVLGQTFSANTSEVITFTGQGTNGCDSIAMVDIIFSEVARGVLDTMICELGSIEIDGVLIDFAGVLEVDFPGQSQAGCDTVTVVTVDLRPPAMGVLDTTICAGDSFVKGFDVYDENMLNGTSLLLGESQFSCDSILEVNVSLSTLDLVEVRDVICGQQEIEVNGQIYNATNAVGMDTVFNQVGCDSIIFDIDLTVSAASATLSNQQICTGDETGTFDIESVSGLELPLMLIINGVTISEVTSIPLIAVEAPVGLNTILLTNGDCEFETSLDLMPLDASVDILVTGLQTPNAFTLGIDSQELPASISWMPMDLIDCTTALCDEAVITIIDDMEVIATFTLMDGCEIRDTTLLTAVEVIPDSTIVIYQSNIFEPSSDNNSVFFIQSNNEALIEIFSIYDRWGNLVFQNENFLSNDPSEGWTGMINSTPAEQGVYVYRILYHEEETNRDEQLVGNVTLIR